MLAGLAGLGLSHALCAWLQFEPAALGSFLSPLEELERERLRLLKTDYPEGYALIQDYFLSDDKVTMPYLASKYGLSIDKIRYRIRIAKQKIKDYIIMHENE